MKFNFCAKRLYRRLLQLGAQSLVEPGYADDQHDLGADAVIHPWISNLWKTLSHFIPSLEACFNYELPLFPPRYGHLALVFILLIQRY